MARNELAVFTNMFMITDGEVSMLTYKIDNDLLLRLFTEDDADEFFQLTIQSKNYLKKWLGWLENIKSVDDITANIKSRYKELEENNGYPINFAIIYKGKIAGTIGFNTIDKGNRIGTIGYWLGEDYQGKGIMSKTFQAVINYGFTDLKMSRIEVRIASKNYKSRAIPERFGFQQEILIRDAEWLYDHYVDHVVYGLLASDWQ